MPLIQVAAPQGVLNKTKQDALMSRLSDAVLRSETASPDDPAAQSLVWAYYREQATGSIYAGGVNSESSPLTIAVTTPEGALNAERREILVAEIGSIVDDLVGAFDGKPNHWAMLYELDEGSWGAGGQIARLADIQSAMNINSIGV
jgi:phenylpyruvate tautomerase PptA (4-oxalocrotonate tautomerase family)